MLESKSFMVVTLVNSPISVLLNFFLGGVIFSESLMCDLYPKNLNSLEKTGVSGTGIIILSPLSSYYDVFGSVWV